MPGVGRCASVGQKCTENQNANWRLLGQNSPWIMDMTHWPRNGHSRLVLGFQEGEKLNTPLWTPAHCDHPRPPQFHWFLQIWDINLLETKKGSNMPYKHWFIKVWDYPTPPTYIWVNGSKFSGIFLGGLPLFVIWGDGSNMLRVQIYRNVQPCHWQCQVPPVSRLCRQSQPWKENMLDIAMKFKI